MLWRRPAKTQSDTVYDALPPAGYESKTTAYKEEEIEAPRRTQPKHSWFSIIITQFLGALWLAPIGYLLYLNFSSYVIGPSAWCPRGHCPADPLASDAVGRAQQFDKHDHNTLGALQFVAKALELWFIFVACALLYNLTMTLASREHGLPVGLLTSPVEFADPRSLIDVVRSALGSRHQRSASISRAAKAAIAAFICFVAFMCLIVNLMGPAVAVLVIPTMQWVNLPKNASHSLQAFHLDKVPRNRSDGGLLFPNCYNDTIDLRYYSCNADAYAASLDTWVDSAIAADSQYVDATNNTMYDGISPEGRVFFTFNATNNITRVAWVPNRQMLRELSTDLDLFVQANQAARSPTHQYTDHTILANDETEASNFTYYDNQTQFNSYNPDDGYGPYINSLQTILKRQGPIAGALGNVYFPTNASFTTLADNKWVRCFTGYTASLPGLDTYNDDPQYTKCLKLGQAWNPVYKFANFTVEGIYSNASVNIYFSDKATYLSEKLDARLLNACRTNSTGADGLCPWETIFDDDHLPRNMSDLRSNVLTVELSIPDWFDGFVVLEAFTFAYNATYTLDTSPVSNPNYLVQVDGIPDKEKAGLEPVVVDPDWLLAAWSADYEGIIYSNRSASLNLVRALEAYFARQPFSNDYYDYDRSTATYDSSQASATGFATGTAVSGTDAAIASGTEAQATDSFTQRTSSISPTVTGGGVNKRQEEAAASTSYRAVTTSMAITPEHYQYDTYPDEYYDTSFDTNDDKATLDLQNFIYFSFLQSLSMVSFDKQNLTKPNTDTKDLAHPTLHYWAMVHVWAYGTDSRTSKFGIAVVLTGCLVVVVSTILGLLVRRRQRSLTELIVAAIEHQHRGELDHANGDGEIAARFRYKIQEDQNDGRVRFVPI